MITIQETPQEFTPAFNPVCFTIISDNYAQPDFKFVADVYDGSGALLATLKYQPQVVGSEPITVDVASVLAGLVRSNYVLLNEVVAPDIVTTSQGAVSDYSVQFGEQYGGTIYANLSSFSGFVFNAALPALKFPFFQDANYKNARFLTRLDRQVVGRTDSAMLSIIQGTDTAITGFDLSVYNMSGTAIYTTTIDNDYDSLSAVDNRVLHLHVGFAYLYDQLGFSGSVYNQAAYYTITPAGGTAMRFDLYSLCERFPGTRLHFLNDLGGIDRFNFRLVSRYSSMTEKKSYLRQPANRATGYDATNRRFEVQKRNYYTKSTETRKVVSDFLTDTESELLAGLMASPLIYMEEDAAKHGGTGKILVPIDLKTTEYTIKKTAIDKLFNLETDLEITQTNYGQII